RDADDVVAVRFHCFIAFFVNDDGDPAAGAYFLDVGDDLGVQGISPAWRWHDDKDRLAFFDQRDWTVLELPGGKTLCVQVSNFFELERAFECDGKADVAA